MRKAGCANACGEAFKVWLMSVQSLSHSTALAYSRALKCLVQNRGNAAKLPANLQGTLNAARPKMEMFVKLPQFAHAGPSKEDAAPSMKKAPVKKSFAKKVVKKSFVKRSFGTKGKKASKEANTRPQAKTAGIKESTSAPKLSPTEEAATQPVQVLPVVPTSIEVSQAARTVKPSVPASESRVGAMAAAPAPKALAPAPVPAPPAVQPLPPTIPQANTAPRPCVLGDIKELEELVKACALGKDENMVRSALGLSKVQPPPEEPKKEQSSNKGGQDKKTIKFKAVVQKTVKRVSQAKMLIEPAAPASEDASIKGKDTCSKGKPTVKRIRVESNKKVAPADTHKAPSDSALAQVAQMDDLAKQRNGVQSVGAENPSPPPKMSQKSKTQTKACGSDGFAEAKNVEGSGNGGENTPASKRAKKPLRSPEQDRDVAKATTETPAKAHQVKAVRKRLRQVAPAIDKAKIFTSQELPREIITAKIGDEVEFRDFTGCMVAEVLEEGWIFVDVPELGRYKAGPGKWKLLKPAAPETSAVLQPPLSAGA